MKIYTLNNRNLWLVLLSCLVLVSCKGDDKEADPILPEQPVPGLVNFVLRIAKMPGEPGATRAILDPDDHIETLDILAFTVDNANLNQVTYAYTTRAVMMETLSNTNNEKVVKYRAQLQLLSAKQRFIFLANTGELAAELDASLSGTYNLNDENFLKQFRMDNPGEWRFEGDIKSIPMYAPATAALKIETTTNSLNDNDHPIYLLRMLANIEIENKAPGYTLKEAYLFKRRIDGYVSYRPADYLSAERRVIKPWVTETGVELKKLQSEPYTTTATNQITNSIYTYETEDPVATNLHRWDATAIVVGISKGSSNLITYYRIDIPIFEANAVQKPNTMGPILRNHRYSILINSVTDEGEDTPEEGYYGTIKINTTVVPWQLIEPAPIDYEDSYNLWVSKTYIKYGKDDVENKEFFVLSTHPEGFKIGYGDDTVWGIGKMVSHYAPTRYRPINPDPDISSISQPDAYKYNVNKSNQNVEIVFTPTVNSNLDSRFASYKFRAGRIIKYVHIEQVGLNEDWNHTATVVDWEDMYLSGGNAIIRLDVERDILYYDGNGSRNNLVVLVTGEAPGTDYNWVVESQSGNWITFTNLKGLADATPQPLIFHLSAPGSERKGTVNLQLGNLTKELTIHQYAGKAIEFKTSSGGSLSVDSDGKTMIVSVKADGTLQNLQMHIKRKGCAWNAEILSGYGELLAGLQRATGSGMNSMELLGLWVNKDINGSVPIDAEARIRISPTEANKQEFEPYEILIKRN